MSHSVFQSVCWPDSRNFWFFCFFSEGWTPKPHFLLCLFSTAIWLLLKFWDGYCLWFCVFRCTVLLVVTVLHKYAVVPHSWLDQMSRVTLSCQTSSWGWLFKIWTLLWTCISLPASISVNVDGCPNIETGKDFVCNAPYFFSFFLVFSVIFQPVLLSVGYSNILVQMAHIVRSCQLQPWHCSTPN